MYCTNCGKQLDDNVNFCIYCGEKISVIEDKTESNTESTNEEVKRDLQQEDTISNDNDQSEEVELFFSEKEKIRKRGEKRYGKGSIKITNKNLYLNYRRKRKDEQHIVPIKNIEKALPILDHYIHMPIGTPTTANMPQDWHVLDIKLFDGSGFQIYIGTPDWGKDAIHIPKFEKIMELLNPPGTVPEDPWHFERVYRIIDKY